MIRPPHFSWQSPPFGSLMILVLGSLSLLFAGCHPESHQPSVTSPALGDMPAGRVRWRAWEEASEASGDSLKPIFLFTYSRRSYWCRELVDRCFANPFLARELERITVPVRIDADLRPDIVARYGMGGWPSLTVLFPDGDIVTGTTYLDPTDLEALLRRLDVLFTVRERREDLERNRSRLQERVAAAASRAPIAEPPTERLLTALVNGMLSVARAGEALSPEAVLFLFEYGHIAGRNDVVEMALGRMVEPSMDAPSMDAPPADPDGLLVRRSLSADGLLRDEEKVLSINARWLRVFARVGRIGRRSPDMDRASSLAAAIRSTLGLAGSPLLAAGHSGFGVQGDSTLALLPTSGARARLDTVAITSWNALAASGLSGVGGSVDADAAASIFNELSGRRTKEGLLPRVEGALPPYHLEDQAAAALAALDIAEAGYEVSEARAFARDIADSLIVRFRDPSGAIGDRWPSEGDAHLPAMDYEMPGAAGLTAQLFIRLGALTSTPGYKEAAAQLITRHLNPNMTRPGQLGSMGRALLTYLHTTEWTSLKRTPSSPQTTP